LVGDQFHEQLNSLSSFQIAATTRLSIGPDFVFVGCVLVVEIITVAGLLQMVLQLLLGVPSALADGAQLLRGR
jgi:hypothetical protein